jgi:hypothetical protein
VTVPEIAALERLDLPVRLLDEPSYRGGNLVALVGEGEEARVLKLYRRRRGRLRSFSRALENRALGKRDVSPGARCRTERLSLDLWTRMGFRVPVRLEAPLPEGIAPPALWMKYCPGETLYRLILNGAADIETLARHCARLGATMDQRHRVALERDEPLLVPEHATVQHVVVNDEHLVHIDHETGYGPGYPLEWAIAREVASTVRTILRAASERPSAPVPGERYTAALVEAYGDKERLAALAQRALRERSVSLVLHRLSDRARRTPPNQTDALRRVLDLLGR